MARIPLHYFTFYRKIHIEVYIFVRYNTAQNLKALQNEMLEPLKSPGSHGTHAGVDGRKLKTGKAGLVACVR
jgi:hypothetical protein